MKLLGWLGVLFVGAGVFMLVVFLRYYDISVAAPGEDGYMSRRVVNLGLMHERNIGVMQSLAAIVVGGMMVGAGQVAGNKAGRHRCSFCRERMQKGAVVCPHCRKEQPGCLKTGVKTTSRHILQLR